MSIALYTGRMAFRRKIGPLAIIGRLQWSQWALGIEGIPWGLILAVGPFSMAVAHLDRNLAALENGEFPSADD